MMKQLAGTPVSSGIAIGAAYVIRGEDEVKVEPRKVTAQQVEAEIQALAAAIDVSKGQLQHLAKMLSQVVDREHASIIEAQTMFLDDTALVGMAQDSIRNEHYCAAFAFDKIIRSFIEQFELMHDPHFRARSRDLADVNRRVLSNLGIACNSSLADIPLGAVIVAHDIPPSETPTLLAKEVKAIVLDRGGPTSHTAILSKALGIPAVVAVVTATADVNTGEQMIVDGSSGQIVLSPTPEIIEKYQVLADSYSVWLGELDALQSQETETLDGYRVTLRANIELPEEIDHIGKFGCRGIGLFRTEFLYMNRMDLPTEEEQFQIYKQAVQKVAPDPVTFRTLDIGGDKFFSHVVMSKELNPDLGQRAVRLCLRQPELFQEHLRAILRASAFGNAKLLIPMISGVDELRAVREQIEIAKQSLRRDAIAFADNIPLGTMIEIPGAALIAEDLAAECDFFSIGTNDLIQYTLAVDRGNEAVAYLYEPANPAVLKFLQMIVSAAHSAGIPVSVCGEAAADPIIALLLTGMGVNELSMSAVSAPQVKKFVRAFHLHETKNLVYQVLKQKTIRDVKSAIRSVLRPHLVKIASMQQDAPNPWFKSSMI